MEKFTRLALDTNHATTLVSVDEIKAHLFITHSDEDAYLGTLASTVTAMIDGPHGIGVVLDEATYRLSLDSLSTSQELPLHPIRAITSITVDGDPIEAANYRVETDRYPAVLYCDTGYVSADKDGIKVTVTAGYETIPQDLKHAGLLLAGHLYRHREATTDMRLDELPFAVASILRRYHQA